MSFCRPKRIKILIRRLFPPWRYPVNHSRSDSAFVRTYIFFVICIGIPQNIKLKFNVELQQNFFFNNTPPFCFVKCCFKRFYGVVGTRFTYVNRLSTFQTCSTRSFFLNINNVLIHVCMYIFILKCAIRKHVFAPVRFDVVVVYRL